MANGTDGAISSEAGGIIKSLNNVYVGSDIPVKYQDDATNFDCYEVSSKSETVPASCKTLKGGTTYSNFDTSEIMYDYTAQSAEDAKNTVMKYAGRVAGGDF